MAAGCVVKFTENFSNNLAEIDRYWQQNEFPAGFDHLLDELETIIANLERFPEMGKIFEARPDSIEALTQWERIQARLLALNPQATLRQYVMDDYLALYLCVANTVYLLAIKHHKQLSFDFAQLWGAG